MYIDLVLRNKIHEKLIITLKPMIFGLIKIYVENFQKRKS